jgi:hypothetical protein
MQYTQIISANCTLAARSKKRVVSADSDREDRQEQEGVDRNQDRVEAVPLDPISSQYCSGRTTKKAQSSAQWSPRRVYGERQELAQREGTTTSPKSRTMPILPKAKADADQRRPSPTTP